MARTGRGAEGSGALALLLTGGGARAAYQVGVLRGVAALYPELQVPILTGVSAGGINTACLAASEVSFRHTVAELRKVWCRLSAEDVFRVDAWSLLRGVVRWLTRLGSGGSGLAGEPRGLVDTAPLWELLNGVLRPREGVITGIGENLAAGKLQAVGLATVDWSTGRNVIWVQGERVETWQRPQRRAFETKLRIDHVMASAALPILFPAVRLEGSWHGDGGVRLATPLAPAIHLGAGRILAVSTRYRRSAAEADVPDVNGYPPPAQIGGVLLNSIFLDLLDQDAHQLERINRLIAGLPEGRREGLRPIRLLTLRPSVDLGRLASEFEPRLPRGFRFLTRGLGTRETRSSDLLSLLLFQPDYLSRLVEIGEADAAAHSEEIRSLVDPSGG